MHPLLPGQGLPPSHGNPLDVLLSAEDEDVLPAAEDEDYRIRRAV